MDTEQGKSGNSIAKETTTPENGAGAKQ